MYFFRYNNIVSKMFKMYVSFLCFSTLVVNTYCSLSILKTCGGSSSAIEASFVSTDSLLSAECTFELIVKPETCSIRIDFDDFLFNQPIKNDNTSAFLCGPDLDLLSLSVVGLPALKLFTLCGDLTGQHIYLPAKDYDAPILKTLLPNKLILTVLSASVQLPGARKPSWSIKLTQLPCPETEKKNRSKKPTRGLAPIGCLQYYTDKEGVFESLNFCNGTGHYFGNLNYAVCFKRYPDTCGIKFVGLQVELASNSNASSGTERDCDTSLEVLGIIDLKTNTDFIIIPDGRGVGSFLGNPNIIASKYCAKSLENYQVISLTESPIYVGVVTDGISNPLEDSEIGFKIKYELLTDCSGLL